MDIRGCDLSFVGQMVRAGSSVAMKVIAITNDIAECWWIDGNGVVRRRFYSLEQLTPMWMSLGPKCLWPDTTQLDLIAIEKEQRLIEEAKRAAKRASKKASRSNKTKRRTAA
jgi:hypothetical protein